MYTCICQASYLTHYVRSLVSGYGREPPCVHACTDTKLGADGMEEYLMHTNAWRIRLDPSYQPAVGLIIFQTSDKHGGAPPCHLSDTHVDAVYNTTTYHTVYQ